MLKISTFFLPFNTVHEIESSFTQYLNKNVLAVSPLPEITYNAQL